MAKISTATLVMVAVVACMAVAAQSALTCGQVASGVAPCLGYLRGVAPLTSTCCGGISALNNIARSTPDRQSACRCLQAAAASIRGISGPIAAGLPGKCGIKIPYKISPSTDCSKVR